MKIVTALTRRATLARLTDTEPTRLVCAWCADFKRPTADEPHVSHGICPTCAARVAKELDVLERSKKNWEKING